MRKSFFETTHYQLWIENDIIFEVFKPSVDAITLDIAKQLVRDRINLNNGVTMPLFVDLHNAVSIDRQSRQYLAKGDAMKYLSATAIVVKNEITRLGGNIYIRIDRPKVPTKLFTSQEKAVEWLAQFRFMN